MHQFQLDKYNILIDHSWDALIAQIKAIAPDRIGLLVDENTRRDCLPILEKALDTSNWHLFEIPSGEKHKTLDTCQFIWRSLMEAEFSRNSLLLNLGGGVIGDMGGFCASTFKRGIAFIQVPTTLLAQVDASVGGKLGIDFQDVKNSIGVFQNPQLVFIQTDFLKTLPFRELRSGFAEIIKHALIKEAGLWKKLLQIEDLKQADWATILPEALAVKVTVVQQDPFEKGLRKILNFGHTIGHAIESLLLHTSSPALHGEAIAAGMICESMLSETQSNLSPSESQAIQTLIHKHYPRLSWDGLMEQELLAFMKQDKKNHSNQIQFVLLEQIGTAVFDQAVPEALILKSLENYSSSSEASSG